MSEQEIIYSEVKSHTPEQQKITRNSESKGSPTPWKIIALILGILFLVSLGAVLAMVAKFFQDTNTSGNFVQQENVHQLQQTYQESHNEPRGSKGSCPDKWKQRGESCYHLPTGWKTWQGSKDYCSSLGSKLLKIENQEELDVIKSLAYTYHWIGLSRKRDNEPWVWEDGTALAGDLFIVTQQGTLQNCVLLVNRGAKSESCDERNPCICEKSVYQEPTTEEVEG